MPEQSALYNLIEHAQEGARREAKSDAALVAAQLQLTGLRAGMDALDLGGGTGAGCRWGAGVPGAIALAPEVLVILPHQLAAARQGPHPVKR
jgi:hypothetical protein